MSTETIVYRHIALFTMAHDNAKLVAKAFPGKVALRKYDPATDGNLGHQETVEVAKAVIVAAAKEDKPVEIITHRKGMDEITAERVGAPCYKCGGKGIYEWGWNGKGFTKSGKCFDCKGKGTMDAADVKRDVYYHNHVERIPA